MRVHIRRIRLTESERYTIGETAALIGFLMLAGSLLWLWSFFARMGA